MVWSVTIHGERVAITDWVKAQTPLPCACGVCGRVWIPPSDLYPSAQMVVSAANSNGWFADLDSAPMLVHVFQCNAQAERVVAALETKPLLLEQVFILLQRRRNPPLC